MAWKIRGTSGATLDGTVRTLDDLRVSAGRVTYAVMSADRLTLSCTADDSAGGGITLPDHGQVLRLFQEDQKVFHGWVTKVRVGPKQVSIEAQGPWWWLDRIALTSDQTLNGTTKERATYLLSTRGASGMIRTIAERAMELGAPIEIGTLDDSYDIIKQTFSNMTVADALRQVMTWVPDGVLWFDHRQADGDVPKLRLTRRGGMTAKTLVVGTDVEVWDFGPRLDLQVKRVAISYMDRHPTSGKPRYQQAASGTAETGKVQIVTVSGPEAVELLPREDFESFDAKNTDDAGVWFNKADSALVATKKKFGSGVGVGVATGQTFSAYRSWSWQQSKPVTNLGTITFKTLPLAAYDENGQKVNLSGRYFMLKGPVPDWLRTIPGVALKTVTVTGTVYRIVTVDMPGSGTSPPALPVPSWIETYGLVDVCTGYTQTQRIRYYAKPFQLQAVLVKKNWKTKTTVYKPWDFDFLNPPSGLEDNLKAAGNWVPWEGTITQVDPSWDGTPFLNRKVNVTGSWSDAATMGALLSSLSYDLLRQRLEYELGAPARLDLGTLVSRVRPEPRDVIVEL